MEESGLWEEPEFLGGIPDLQEVKISDLIMKCFLLAGRCKLV